MRKFITLFAVLGLVLALAPAAQAAIILSDGHTGSFRIIFVTLDNTLAQDTGIAFYNSFVSTQAGLAGSTQTKDLATTWTAVGSTKLTSAISNTGTTGAGTGIHIYTPSATLGTYTLVATSYDALWNAASVDILSGIRYGDGTLSDEANGGGDQIWTGTNADGSSRAAGADGSYLGSGPNGDNTASNMQLVRGGKTDGGWVSAVSDHDLQTKNMMALSGLLGLPPAGTVFIIQ